jgi:hypothetical protein
MSKYLRGFKMSKIIIIDLIANEVLSLNDVEQRIVKGGGGGVGTGGTGSIGSKTSEQSLPTGKISKNLFDFY